MEDLRGLQPVEQIGRDRLHAGSKRLVEPTHCGDVLGIELQRTSKRHVPENVAAVRWLDQRFEPIMESIPADLLDRLEAAEIFHQLLEHRWYMAEQAGRDISIDDALADYLALLEDAPVERVQLDTSLGDTGELTGPLPIFVADEDHDDSLDVDPWELCGAKPVAPEKSAARPIADLS